MTQHTLTLSQEELKQVLSALGERIERLDERPQDYDPRERKEARAACMRVLEEGTRIEYEASRPGVARRVRLRGVDPQGTPAFDVPRRGLPTA